MSHEEKFFELAFNPVITKSKKRNTINKKIKWIIWKRKLIKAYLKTTMYYEDMFKEISIQSCGFLCAAFLIINKSGKLKFGFPMDYIDPAYYNMIYYMNDKDIIKNIKKSVNKSQFDAWQESRRGVDVKSGRFR